MTAAQRELWEVLGRLAMLVGFLLDASVLKFIVFGIPISLASLAVF